MNLSPLRKQVQTLNKDLESQNIQIKDLIRFLNKSTPNNSTQRYQSPMDNFKNLLNPKDSFSQNRPTNGKDQKNKIYKELRQNKSLKYLKPFYPIKTTFEPSSKYITSRQIQMSKSVTFHNIHNALTTRKYLKLSRPEKKTNSSCSFCREATFGSKSIMDCSKIHKVQSKMQTSTKMTESKQFSEKPQLIMKNNSRSKSKPKQKQKQQSGKSTPFKELGPNQILSKNQMRSFIEKKSKTGITKQHSKSKAKLLLNDYEKHKNSYNAKKIK